MCIIINDHVSIRMMMLMMMMIPVMQPFLAVNIHVPAFQQDFQVAFKSRCVRHAMSSSHLQYLHLWLCQIYTSRIDCPIVSADNLLCVYWQSALCDALSSAQNV